MVSRKYNKLIEIWQSSVVADGFGGSTVTDALQYTMWSYLETKRAFNTNENGQRDNFVQTVFIVRNRVSLDISIKDNFIKYNGIIYNIDSVMNIDLDNIDIEIYASQRG